MKTKNIILVLILLLVLGAGAYLATRKDAGKSTLEFDETAFSVADTSAVNKIQFTKADTNKVVLTRQQDGRWLINNNYSADTHYINTLLATLRNLSIRKPVAKAQQNETIQELKAGTQVEVYEGDKLISSFYVNPASADGSYFLNTATQEPYVVQLRGYTGNIATIFDMNADEMRDKLLFSSTLRSLQSLQVEYSFLPQENFSINFQDSYYKVSGVENPDSVRLEDYINLYNAVYLERYLSSDRALQDSLINVIPIATIKLTDLNNTKNKTVRFYSRTGSDSVFFGLIEPNNEVILVEAEPVQNLLLRKDYFRKN